MPSVNYKKLLIMYILYVLKEHTDENHPLTQQELIDKIESLYDLKVERKAIANNIESLIDLGYDVIKVHKKGYFLGAREFEPSEIQFLVDSVFSSKVINSYQSKNLAKKLQSFLSINQRKKYNYIYKADEISKTNNKQIFYNIDIINEAIEKEKKILFTYNEYDINKKLVSKNKGKKYLVNPYFMVNSQGKYYLVCNYDSYDNIGNYKIDLITDISIVDKPIKRIKDLKNYKNGIDIAKYINENIYMFASKVVEAKIKITDESMIRSVIDWFGDKTKLYKKDNQIFAEIKVNETALIYWALQYGQFVEVVSPTDTRDKIKSTIKEMSEKYKN